jgi:hypothetical protein
MKSLMESATERKILHSYIIDYTLSSPHINLYEDNIVDDNDDYEDDGGNDEQRLLQ